MNLLIRKHFFARKKSLLVIVHYWRDAYAIQHSIPHNNRKQFLERTRVKTMSSTLKSSEGFQINKTSCRQETLSR